MLRFTPPPSWPAPPEGFVPPPGWRPDPSWPPAPPGWNFWQPVRRSWALDRAVAETPGTGWSLRLGLYPVLALVAVLVAEGVVLAGTGWQPRGLTRYAVFAVASVLHYAAALAVIARLGRTAVRAAGGWAAAFGWRRGKPIDLALGLGGAVAEYIGRIVVIVLLVVAVPALRGRAENNIDLSGRPTAEIVLLLILAVAIAPPVEELIFRGVLLRSLMRRLRFWPAALISSVLFAALHLYEVGTAAAMVLLFASIVVFGIGQCLLVRWTGRLATSIVAHAVSNAAAALLTLAAGR
jgi:membrane protease YdiL (CAAX protease family)